MYMHSHYHITQTAQACGYLSLMGQNGVFTVEWNLDTLVVKVDGLLLA